jgi:hypothetical protein
MLFRRSTPHRFRRIALNADYRRRPRGFAVVMVLGLLAITLAISYATLRGQGTTTQLARNNSRALDARVAAQSGLAAALRKISENAWGGVTSTLSTNVTNSSWYVVSYTTGDAKLATTDPNYSEYPFRLTIDSIGYASDPLNPAIKAQHHSRCTVQLVRKQLVAEPAAWPVLTSYTVSQCGSGDVYVQFPVRIDGSACLLGKLNFCTEYPAAFSGLYTARDQYLSDLYARKVAGLGDYRPFPDNLAIRGTTTTQDATTMSLLSSKLGIAYSEANNLATLPSLPSHPGSVLKYKLYPGGAEYVPPIIQNSLGNPIQNVTLAPDPLTNPLGIYRSTGSLSVQSNVQITGTVISDGGGSDIQVYGTNVVLKPLNLPALYGSSQTYELPAVIAVSDLRMNSGSSVQIGGSTLVWNEFEIKDGTTTSSFALTGNLMTNTLLLRGRTTGASVGGSSYSWTQAASTWFTDKAVFSGQVNNANGVKYFPDYEEQTRGFTVKPSLTFARDSSGVVPHWHDWTQPVYQPDPSDPGLRWEVVRWEDNLQ